VEILLRSAYFGYILSMILALLVIFACSGAGCVGRAEADFRLALA